MPARCRNVEQPDIPSLGRSIRFFHPRYSSWIAARTCASTSSGISFIPWSLSACSAACLKISSSVSPRATKSQSMPTSLHRSTFAISLTSFRHPRRLFCPALRMVWLFRRPKYKSLQRDIRTPRRPRIGTLWNLSTISHPRQAGVMSFMESRLSASLKSLVPGTIT